MQNFHSSCTDVIFQLDYDDMCLSSESRRRFARRARLALGASRAPRGTVAHPFGKVVCKAAELAALHLRRVDRCREVEPGPQATLAALVAQVGHVIELEAVLQTAAELLLRRQKRDTAEGGDLAGVLILSDTQAVRFGEAQVTHAGMQSRWEIQSVASRG